MATTVTALLPEAKRRYALDASASDALLPNQLLIDRVNEILARAARSGVEFFDDLTVSVVANTAKVIADPSVINIIDNTMRLDDGSGNYANALDLRDEMSLRALEGPLESVAAGTPNYYYMRREKTADAMLAIYLFPRPANSVTNGLKYSARVSPAVLTTSDNLPINPNEKDFLIPGLCLAMAEVEMADGRVNAPVQYWAQMNEQALDEWAATAGMNMRGNRRTIHITDPGGAYYY